MARPSFSRSPTCVALFVSLLVIVQLVAVVMQFRQGFFPFRGDAVRVPFSWDMFANRLERCSTHWNPPIRINEHVLGSLRDVELPFEWDLILDWVNYYRLMMQELCGNFGTGPTRAKLHCYLHTGTTIYYEFKCK